MSALDLDALEAACRDCAAARALKEEADTAWLRMEKSRPRGQQHVSSEEQAVASEAVEADYALDRALDGIAVDERALLDLITRLRAAEARTAWADSLVLQAHSMATAIEQGDEDGELDALGPVTAAIIRSDVARMLEIVAERPAAPEAP